MKRLVVVGVLGCFCAASSAAAPPPTEAQLKLLRQQFALASQPSMKILVKKDGWYRVTFAALRKAGFPVRASAPPRLQLFADGAQVSIQVKRGALEFYGQGLDTDTTDTRTYWLVAGKARGVRAPVVGARATAAPARGWFPATVDARQRENYQATVKNGSRHNFFGPGVRSGQATNVKVATPRLAPSAPGSVKVAVQGISLKPHKVKVSLNGTALGTLEFANDKAGSETYKIEPAALKENENTISMTATGGELDLSVVDSVEFTYPHSFVADGDVLSFPVRGGQPVSAGGFSKRPRLFDISRPERPRELVPTVQSGTEGGHVLSVTPPAGATRLLALSDDKIGQPVLERNRSSKLSAASRAADLLVLSHRDFIPALKPLVEFRKSQGLNVAVADIADVYDEFSFGAHGPQAIKDLLEWTTEQWQRAPRYVLLVGDATNDPRNFRGKGDFDLVPTAFVETVYLEAPSDDTLADFNDDGVPEMAVGRLAVRTAAQAAAVVAKIVGYERGSNTARSVLLVSDKNIDYDFEAESETLSDIIPPAVTVSRVNRKEGPTDAGVRSRLLAALNQGPTIVNFFGHGAIDIWTSGSILKTTDAPNLTNGRSLSLYLMMTCLNGYFVVPEGASLSEALLLAPNGGAIAAWSSSGLTVPTDQVRADQEAVKLLLTDPEMTLGDAMVRGKQVIRDIDVRHTWILHGDPTTRLR